MATSGVDIYTVTAGEVIKDALVLINVVPATQAVTAADSAAAMRALNALMQTWTMDGVYPWRKQSGQFTPVQGQAEYSLPQRPLEIIDMRWVQNGGTEISLFEVSHDEYIEQPNKSAQGQPSLYYVRRNVTDTSVYLWPTPSVVTTQTVAMSYNRRTQIVTDASEDIDLPQEWIETLTYNLAGRLGDQYGAKGEIYNRVLQRAEYLYDQAKMFERVGVQSMYPDDQYGGS